MTSSSEVDVVSISAGAAGLAAARRLGAAPVSVLVIEARSRIGGRAWTVNRDGFRLDLGCGWLHSADRNPWVGMAEDFGFSIDRTAPPWGRQAGNRGFSAADQREFRAESSRFYQRMEEVARDPEDRPASELLDPRSRWNGLIDAVSTFINGVETDQVSVHDFDAYADTGINWRVVEGYGATVATFGAGLPVALETTVTRVDHGASPMRIETSRGTMRARAVVVAVPTPALASEAVRFDPPLPDKVAAADALPLGLADKIFLSLDGADEFPEEANLYGDVTTSRTGAYHLRPFGLPIIEGFFAGALARELEESGPGAFYAFASDQLAALFGSGIRTRLSPLATYSWGTDPYALGSYSHARPGYAGARKRLASPVEERIFFAGEAVSPDGFTTAHGAYATGLAAAEAVLKALSPI